MELEGPKGLKVIRILRNQGKASPWITITRCKGGGNHRKELVRIFGKGLGGTKRKVPASLI